MTSRIGCWLALALVLSGAPALAQTRAPGPAAGMPATAPAVPAAPAAVATPQAGAAPRTAAAVLPPAAASAGSLLQTILALLSVLALLAGLAWLLKRYGPKAGGAGGTLRLVASLGLGGRERILVIEVADQWIVVGAAPGRVNALATLPRPDSAPSPSSATLAGPGQSANSFADWLKQTMEKRHGK